MGDAIGECEQEKGVLREREDWFRRLVEQSTDGILLTDERGAIIEWNRGQEEITGLSRDEVLGHSLWDVQFRLIPEGRNTPEMCEKIKAGTLEFLKTGQSPWSNQMQELVIVRSDGSHRIVQATAFPIETSEGFMVGTISRDVTEHKQDEIEHRRLQAALEHRSTLLQTAAEVSKSAGTILDPNELIERTVNLIRERFNFYYVGLFLVDEAGEYAVLRAGTGEAGRQMLAAGHRLEVGGDSMVGWCVAHRQARIALDVGQEAIRFDNPLLPLTRSEMALPLMLHDRMIGALTVQSAEEAAFSQEDITVLQVMADQLAIAIENARLYERIRRYASELEQRVAERTVELAAVNKELEAFAYSVSHDLRAPLRSIDGFSRALLEDYEERLDVEGQDYLHRIRAACRRMGQLIDDLLRLSRVTRSEMRYEEVSLSALIQEIAVELQETQPERRVEFTIQPGLVVDGDRQLLRVAMENLLGNAWKFTGKREQARIAFGLTEVGDKQVYFVRDNGVGFDTAYAHKLFVAFQRLHSLVEFEGNGIGLATVQRIIRRHGGQVWAEGAVGQGATFYFTLGTKTGGQGEEQSYLVGRGQS
ncbi:MAG TPA: PAS domain S-box protein [Chloroflexi bacterium]|nr:PAS domain S-box protein [Chloroflexota bacterium]